MKKIMLHFGWLFLLNFKVEALMIYTLSNQNNAGDHSQALGIARALKECAGRRSGFKDLNTKTTTSFEIKQEIENVLPHEKVIVIGTGEGGIDGIEELSPNPNLMICLTSHMFLERYKDPKLLEKVRFIALPTHTPSHVKKQLGAKLIETIGVAHNHQHGDPDKVYETWGAKELPSCKVYLGVILGGDAPVPGPQENVKFFTEKDARKLADYIAQNSKGACVLVLNGPRTGKYDLNQKEIPTAHRNGNSDHITKLFEKQLAMLGIQNIKIFNFQHNSPENQEWILPYNSFELVVGALRAANGMMLIPGDSTSDISEAIDMLAPGKVLVYETNAMNEVHKAHLASELAMGRISVLEGYHYIKRPALHSSALNPTKLSPPAAMTIAQKIWNEFNQSR